MLTRSFAHWNEWMGTLLGWRTVALLLILFFIYQLIPRPNRWKTDLRKRMEKTFKRTELFIEEKKGSSMEKLLPELLSLEVDGPYYVFRYQLIPGLSVKQYVEKKPFFDAAFNADTYISGSGNQLTIKVEKEKHQQLSL